MSWARFACKIERLILILNLLVLDERNTKGLTTNVNENKSSKYGINLTRSREQKVKPVATANLPTRVGPGAKLEVALLVVEGKPRDVDLAHRLKKEKCQHGATNKIAQLIKRSYTLTWKLGDSVAAKCNTLQSREQSGRASP